MQTFLVQRRTANTALSQTKLRCTTIFGVSLLFLSFSSTTHAQTYFVNYSGQVTVGAASVTDGGSASHSPTQETSYTTPVLTYSVTNTQPNQSGTETATTYGTASLGELHAYASGSGSGSGAGSEDTQVSFTDLLTITSAKLPENTPVTFQEIMNIHDTISGTYDSQSAYNASYITATLSLYDTSNTNSYQSLEYKDSIPNPTNGGSINGTFQGFVGEQIKITGILLAQAGQGATYTSATSYATADAANTGNFYINSITPDTSYSSASGTSYESPSAAPEPSQTTALGLTLLGISGLCWLARRKAASRAVQL